MTLAIFSTRKTAPCRFAPYRSLRSAAKLGLGLLSLGLFVGHPAHAGTVNWDGTAADWFVNPSHWVGGLAPGAGDAAVNDSAAAMTLGQSTTIQSFFSNGAFTLQGGTFSGSLANAAGTITVNNVFTDNGGTINNFTINQGTGGSLVFANNGGNNLINSVVNADISLADSGFVRAQGANTVNGTINLSTTSNGLNIYDGNANLTLGSTGKLVGFGSVFQSGGGATLTNNGTVNANTSGQTLGITTTNFVNTGTAEATNGGILSLTNTLTNTGALSAIGAGSVVSLSGTLTNGLGNLITASNGGQIQVNGATLLGTINEASGTSLIFNNNGGNNFVNTSVNGNLDLATNANAFLRFQGAGTVNGAINLATTSNGLNIYDGNANLTLSNQGSLVGFGNVFQSGGGATLTNNGTVNANAGGKALAIGTTNFVNNGTAEATNGGILSLNNSTTNTGTIAANTGGTVNIAGTLTSSADSHLNGAGGTVNVTGATLFGIINTNLGTALIFNNDGGNNLINTTVNGTLDLVTNANAFVRAQGANTVNGTINLGTTSNGLDIYDGNANLTLNGGSLVGFGSVFQQGGGATLTNNGTVNANANGKTLAITTTNFVNNNLAEATNGGILSLSNSTVNNGTLAAKSGGIVDITGTLTSNAGNVLDGAGGTVNVQGATLLGTINEASGTSLIFNNDGGNNFVNTSISGGSLDLATNAAAFLRFQGVGTVGSAIQLGTTGNGLDIYDGNASLTLNGSLSGFGSVFQQGGGATLTNNGTVNATGGTMAVTTTNFVNNNVAEATGGGTLALNNSITGSNGSTLSAIGAGSLVTLTGTYTGTGSALMTASGGGQVQVKGATLLGTINTDTNTALVLNGDGNNKIINTTVNGNLDLATNNNAFLLAQGADTVSGQITLGTTSNGLDIYDGNANLTLNGGSLVGFGTVFQQGGGATLTNNGTVNANVSGQALNISTSSFVNAGTTEVQNGAALTVTSAVTDSGNILVKNGGTATFTQPLTQSGGLTQANGTLNTALTLTGGKLAGTGTVNGAVENNGGTVAAGDPFGTLSVNGTFKQGSGGTLNVGFDNVMNSLLAVNGAVLTGGVLDVNYLGSGPYTSTEPFTFLTYGSLTSLLTGAGPAQYFSNETFLSDGTGVIAGHNGFTYALFNDATHNGLQLSILSNGAPTPAVPEASTTVSLGLLLMLGGGGLLAAKRRRTATAS